MDFMPTKGIEYLLVIGYLLLFVPVWMLIQRGRPKLVPIAARAAAATRQAASRVGDAVAGWFRVPQNLFFHRGHTWVEPREAGIFRLGLDDFAHKLLGRADRVELPPVGGRIEAGEPGFALSVAGKRIPALAPLSGEVVRVNPAVLADPALALADPYAGGWLVEVRAERPHAALRNLLPGNLAQRWIEQATRGLMARMSPELGTVLQDGGVPVAGIARELDRDGWDQLAKELLLVAEDSSVEPPATVH